MFREGFVVSAFTASSPLPDPRLSTLPKASRETAIRRRLGFALEELARLREGAFGFELTDAVPVTVAGRDIRAETLAVGINPQEMLLTLAQGMDDDRAQSAAAVEASFATPAEGIMAAELAAFAPPLVPAEAVRSAFADEPQALDAPEASEGGDEWQTTPSERYGPDTRPLPKLTWEAMAQAATGESGAAAAGAVEAGAAPPVTPAPAEAARTILLVDDEADVRQVLGQLFGAAGFEIVEAADPEGAAKLAATAAQRREAVRAGDGPRNAGLGRGIVPGGLRGDQAPVEDEPAPARADDDREPEPVAAPAGAADGRPVVRVQAHPQQDRRAAVRGRPAGLRREAREGRAAAPRRGGGTAAQEPAAAQAQAQAPAEPAAEAGAPAPEGASRPFEFLKRRLVELRQGGDANEIAMLVMKVAREFFERALLFVVKNDEARGLGGFGLAPRDEALNLLARQITIPLGEASLFKDVARERRPFSGAPPNDRWLGHMMGRIGRFQSRGIAILPLVAHRETIAIVFGDNPESGRDPGSLEPLEVFVQQAGIALENVFLQKKLQAAEDKDRASLR